MSDFIPTWLYIKQHNITGLKYFGKTQQADPYKYAGSGKYWRQHLRKHGNDVTTLWVRLFTDQVEMVQFAIDFSTTNNIVSAKKDGKKIWANEIDENGTSGMPKGWAGLVGEQNPAFGKPGYWLGKSRSPETSRRMSEAFTGRKLTDEHRRKIGISKQGNTIMLGKHHSEETKKKLSQQKLGVKKGPNTAIHNARISAGLKGKKKSKEHLDAISEARLGKQIKARARLVCPHCGKEVGQGNKWHFDNCKMKDNNGR